MSDLMRGKINLFGLDTLVNMIAAAGLVCMSRRICVELYDAIVALRPRWHDDDDDRGAIKVVMTGSAADPAAMQPHIRGKAKREALAKRFKDAGDPFRIVIVRDMWLTGFDAPCLHTMYLDKAMQGHGLMQVIARVNRVFHDKLGGLVMDYLGLADQLKRALATYTESGGTGRTAIDQNEAARIRDDVAFFQAVRSVLAKNAPDGRRSRHDVDHALRQIVSRAVSSDEVIDIFAAAGLEKPEISVLDDRFLAEDRDMPQRNLAVEMLRKLLNNEIRTRSRRNIVQARSFTELLEQSIRKYQNRAVETAQVIEELIALARELREAGRRGEELGLNDDELAFYDALAANDSAVQVLGDDTLRDIARELVESARRNVTIDWTMGENVRAHLRVIVKRILRKHGYPPGKQERATQTVVTQAEVLSQGWALNA